MIAKLRIPTSGRNMPDNGSVLRSKLSILTLVWCALMVCIPLASVWAAPAQKTKNALHIFFVDVEGGQATLFVRRQNNHC